MLTRKKQEQEAGALVLLLLLLLLPSAIIRRVTEPIRLMIVAGEPSGDAHAAALVNALREISPGIQLDLFGGTGPLMRAAGVESVTHTDDLAILGLLEIGRALPRFWRA